MSRQTYGIPYKGSKSRIVEDMIKALPSGKRLVDLFGGGGSVSHMAVLSGKYGSVLYNEIQESVVRLFKDAIAGKYSYENFTPEFISRAEFDRLKISDAYVKYIWSFGNNGMDYLFSREIEQAKGSVHNFVVFNKKDGYIHDNYPDVELTGTDIENRRLEWMRKIKGRKENSGDRLVQLERLSQLQQLEQLQRINKLQQLEELDGQVIEFSCGDYRDYVYREGDVVYCDPPYEAARGYGKKFDSVEFYDWVDGRDYPVYFSSYDDITDMRFRPIWAKAKRNLARGTVDYDVRIETLYCNRAAGMDDLNFGKVKEKQEQEQMTIFEVTE